MAPIRGTMLLPLDAASYRQHLARHTFLARANKGSTQPDPRLALTRLVEDQVRQALAQPLGATPWRVLRWEQPDPANRYRPCYRELDGVFKAADGRTVLLEVKASASKNSLKGGLAQLRAAVDTARHAHPGAVGLLCVADLGAWYDEFGEAATWPVQDWFADKDVTLLPWPPRWPEGPTAGLCVCVVPDEVLGGWLPPEPERAIS